MRLNINGIDTELKFTMWMMERMNALNAKFENSLTWPKVALIYSGLETYYRNAKEANPFSIEEIEIWSDNLTETEEGNALLEKISEAFTQSVVFRKVIDMSNAVNDQKKTSNGVMSIASPSES